MKKFGVDDWIMVAAMFFAILNVAVAGLGTLSAFYLINPISDML